MKIYEYAIICIYIYMFMHRYRVNLSLPQASFVSPHVIDVSPHGTAGEPHVLPEPLLFLDYPQAQS